MMSETITHRETRRAMPYLAVSQIAWQHVGLLLTLAVAAVLNGWQLAKEGYANAYYAAAVRSMMQSWHNFFFVSFDPGGFVTVDKPPLGFWVQTASAKLFGFHGWSILLPQAIAGVLSVAVLYHLVRRVFDPTAGLVAAFALAVTPISVVTNRNNTIDSLLVLTVLLATWAMGKATETGQLRWLLASMTLVGLGFNIKMLQAYLVLPALVLVYLLGVRHGGKKRIGHLAIATVVLLAVSLSWATAVDLTPASQRPYVGSTTNNSELSLALGYNGLQRLLGHSGGGSGAPTNRVDDGSTTDAPTTPPQAAGNDGAFPVGLGAGGPGGNGGPGGIGENGAKGVLRLFDQQLGGQIAWLLPLALIGLGAAGWQRAASRARRHDALAAGVAGSPPLPVPTRVFARITLFARGPLDRREQAVALWGTWTLTMAAFFSVAGFFHRYYLSMLAPGIAALVGIGVAALWRAYGNRQPLGWLLPVALVGTATVQAKILAGYPTYARWMTPLVLGVGIVAALALVLARVRTTETRQRLAVAAATAGLCALLVAPTVWAGASVRDANGGGIPSAGPQTPGMGFPGGAPGGMPPTDGATGNQSNATGSASATTTVRPQDDGGQPFNSGGQVNSSLLAYLTANRGNAKFLVAVPSSQSADSIIIQTGEPVMAMGGFTGSDPILTTTRVAQLVNDGTVRYFLLGGAGPGGGASSVTQWVTSSCTAVPSSAYQSSTGTTSAATGGGFSFGGAQTLYDCRVAATG